MSARRPRYPERLALGSYSTPGTRASGTGVERPELRPGFYRKAIRIAGNDRSGRRLWQPADQQPKHDAVARDDEKWPSPVPLSHLAYPNWTTGRRPVMGE